MTGNPTDTSWAKKFVAGDGVKERPSYGFGSDSNTGFYLDASDEIGVAIAGFRRFRMVSTTFKTNSAAGPGFVGETASSTNPTFLPDISDLDTGLGKESADAVCLISGGVNATTYREASSAILQASNINVGLTADTGSIQGGQVLTSSYNIISVCANAGDAVTLPASFLIGTIVRIKNDGANSCDVFPASGDNLGAGADTAAALAAGASITYIASAVSTTWTSIGN